LSSKSSPIYAYHWHTPTGLGLQPAGWDKTLNWDKTLACAKIPDVRFNMPISASKHV
jgi:hypothetical protein